MEFGIGLNGRILFGMELVWFFGSRLYGMKEQWHMVLFSFFVVVVFIEPCIKSS